MPDIAPSGPDLRPGLRRTSTVWWRRLRRAVGGAARSVGRGSREQHRARRPAALPGGGRSYGAAAHRLKAWIHDGILVRDAEPALYLCEQSYRRPSGGEAQAPRLFAAPDAGAVRAGSVIPMKARSTSHAPTGPAFWRHPRPPQCGLSPASRSRRRGGAYGGAAMEARRSSRRATRTETTSRVARVGDRERIDFLTRRSARSGRSSPTGHHRYESALAYRDERRARGLRDASMSWRSSAVSGSGSRDLSDPPLVHSIPGSIRAASRAPGPSLPDHSSGDARRPGEGLAAKSGLPESSGWRLPGTAVACGMEGRGGARAPRACGDA